MNNFRISKQNQAENDSDLIECFHDAGFITSLIESNFSIISGRKGTGKTALARFLEKKYSDYAIDFACRISVRDITIATNKTRQDRLNSILLFIIIRSVQKLLDNNIFNSDYKTYWVDFLNQNGLQSVLDYQTFVETQKNQKSGLSFKTIIGNWIGKVEAGVQTEDNSQFTRSRITESPGALIESLKQSLPVGKDILIFIDDLSDYLDNTDIKLLADDISIIKDLLLSIEGYNSLLSDSKIKLRFVSLVRDDLFSLMLGSNINKLEGSTLKLEWNEKSFAGLLIRRLPFFSDNLEEYLKQPIESLRKEFPDIIFTKALENFNTKRYATNFYAYMIAISFNRPRDFLMFCFAMRERLSNRHVATFENIESAEIEYSDYFRKELRDELFLASRILKFNAGEEGLNQLIDLMAKKDGFNSPELRSEFAKYLGEKTSLGRKKIDFFIQELWRYGVLGFSEKGENVINYNYISGEVILMIDKIKNYAFYLHRGLWWFIQKRRK